MSVSAVCAATYFVTILHIPCFIETGLLRWIWVYKTMSEIGHTYTVVCTSTLHSSPLIHGVCMTYSLSRIEPLQIFPLQMMSSHVIYVIITLHIQCRKWSQVLGSLHLFVGQSGCPSKKGCIISIK